MIGYYMILLLGFSGAVLGAAPPYVQSYEAFIASKIYVSGKLPIRKMDIHKVADRPHISFAMLTGVTGGLLLIQDKPPHIKTPLEVVDEFVPIVWPAYDKVAKETQTTLNEATHKISLIVGLINSVCGSANVEECNTRVDRIVNDAPFSYRLSADLLLALGKVAVVIRDNQSMIDSINETNNDIPYLIHNVETKQFLAFLNLLRIVQNYMNQLSYRRLLSDD